MDLLSPQKIVFAGNVVKAFSEFDFTFREGGEFGITQHGRLPKLFIGTEVLTPGGSARITIDHYAPSDETIGQFLSIQRLVNTCINNAEEIKRELHLVAERIYRTKPDLAKESGTYDFMKLKDIFTDYMKKDDKTRHLANKAFRRAFNQFVIDRNIYTHGKLSVRNGDNAFVLSYKDNSTKIETYAVVNTAIIQSYYDAYRAIKAKIREFRTLSV